MVKAGDNYGDESYGNPPSYFKYAKFVMLGTKYKVLFDLDIDNKRSYLPEMNKI